MSKFKAFDKRTKTLLVEYKNQFKSNKFIDKRIGENDQSLSLEDKIFKRFVHERQKKREKKSQRFNLNDDDDNNNVLGGGDSSYELTHLGQSLSQIERFESAPMSDDDDDDDNRDPANTDRGRINAKIVSENFFGGFEDEDGKKDDEDTKKKSRKEWIDELIAKSKQLKYERQKERDKTLDLTEALDKEWASLRPIVNKISNEVRLEKEANEFNNPRKADEFDSLVRTLQFDSTAHATDKTKTPQQLEKERQELIKIKEKELLERMQHEVEHEEPSSSEKRKDKSWKKISANGKMKHVSPDEIEFDDPEYLEFFKRENIKANRKAEEDAENDKADKKNESDDDDNQEEEEEDEDDEDVDENESDSNQSDLTKTANEDWTKKLEASYSKLKKGSLKLNDFSKQLKSIVNSLDPSKDEANKQRICLFVRELMNTFRLECQNYKQIDKSVLNMLTKLIYELTYKHGNKSTRQEPSPFIGLFKARLNEINSHFSALGKINERKFPQLDILLEFKLISIVFPTSDFRHLIITPCLILMNRFLTQCSIETTGDLFRGTFLTSLLYEFVSKSRRFIPECIQFLNGTLYLAAKDKSLTNLKRFESSTIYETFKRTSLNLQVTTKVVTIDKLALTTASHDQTTEPNDKLKVSLITFALNMLSMFASIYRENVSFREIFALTKKLIGLLPMSNYPVKLQNLANELQENITLESNEPREHLKCLNKKPEPSRQFVPKIVSKSKFDPRHHNSVISEKQLDRRKYKKELKSAIKEIRQDNQFLARVQLDEQMEKDRKRSQKVKEIMSSLSNQEGEYQKAKRQKS